MSGMDNYRINNEITYKLNYHFVFCTRYRRKIFIEPELEKRFDLLVRDICDDYGIQVTSIICGEDYAYITLTAPPSLSPTDIMAKIKRTTSKKLREEFSYLKHLPSLWTRLYLVSTDAVISESIIQKYVEQQKTRG